jgi:hypothetical protein
MNENIDLTQILKDCPKGTKFWSMLDEEVEFVDIDKDCIVFRVTKTNKETFYYNDGKAYRGIGECVLFPSKEQRDWSKFVPTWKTKKEVVKVTLHPFDKVLAWSIEPETWGADIFSHYDSDNVLPIWCIGGYYKEVIPYNKDTAHLLGTSDKPEIEYEIEFSKEFKEEGE